MYRESPAVNLYTIELGFKSSTFKVQGVPLARFGKEGWRHAGDRIN